MNFYEQEEVCNHVKERQKYREKLFQLMMDTLDTSSFHAIPNIVRNKYQLIKAMWIVCLLTAISASAYSINKTVVDYLNFSVITTTRNIDENPISFPAITICNLNTLNLPPSNLSEELLIKTLNYSQLYFLSEHSKRLNYKNNRFSIISYTSFAPEIIQDQLGFSLDHLIVSCIFNNKDCDLNRDFLYYFDSMFGKCYRFNFKRDKFIKKTGVENGLQLELYTTSAFDNMNNYSINNGWRIYISDFVNFISYNYDGVTITNGYSTNIEISKNSLSKQPYPYSSCVRGLTTIDAYPSRSYKYTFSINGNYYTADNCLNMCFQLMLQDICQCYDASSGPFPGPFPVCSNDDQLICDDAVWTDFLEKNYFLTLCDCPFSCETIEYKFKTSMCDYPTKFYADFLLTDEKFKKKFPSSLKYISYEQIRQSLSSVNIYFNQMVNRISSEEPKKPTIVLISDIGGLLSLFIGVSFLSLIEFIEIIIQIVYVFLEKLTANTDYLSEKLNLRIIRNQQKNTGSN